VNGMFLIDDLLRFPIEVGIKVLRTIAEAADNELLRTEESVRKKVMETQLRYERGEMEEVEYREQMVYLRARLKEVKGD